MGIFGRSGLRAMLVLAIAISAAGLATPVQARDFFSALFGAFGARPPAPPSQMLPFANDEAVPPAGAQRTRLSGGSQAWCVRTCDGRYFPITGPDKAGSCNDFCPASTTELLYGGNIDNAVTEAGKPYSELPNAFRYRSEIVAGCTCNGKNQIGLAPVSIDHDPTLRKGDIVAGPNGLVVANRNAGTNKSADLNFSPLPPAAQARIHRVPVVASE